MISHVLLGLLMRHTNASKQQSIGLVSGMSSLNLTGQKSIGGKWYGTVGLGKDINSSCG